MYILKSEIKSFWNLCRIFNSQFNVTFSAKCLHHEENLRILSLHDRGYKLVRKEGEKKSYWGTNIVCLVVYMIFLTNHCLSCYDCHFQTISV